jgi:hypothetical protein
MDLENLKIRAQIKGYRSKHDEAQILILLQLSFISYT